MLTGVHGPSSQFKYGDLISTIIDYYFDYCFHSIQSPIKVQFIGGQNETRREEVKLFSGTIFLYQFC